MQNLYENIINYLAIHGPVLHVAVPMAASAINIIISRSKQAFYITFFVILFCFLNSLVIANLSFNGGANYEIGGFPAPMGIEYRLDSLSGAFIFMISFFAILLMPYCRDSARSEIKSNKRPIFYSLFLLCYAGLCGIILTNDLFNIYVFLEISSLSTYALIAMGRDRRAFTASYSYLILGTIGATFILIGIGLLYIMTGTLNITDVSHIIADIKNISPIRAAFSFLIVGIILKIALFPLHIWLTNAYAHAPNFVSAFLSCTSTKVGLYLFLRLVFFVFGYDFSFKEMPTSNSLIVLSIAAIFLGSLSAIYNENLKRIIAFSSVAQIGFITLLIAMGTKASLAAAMSFIFNHGLSKSLLFASAGMMTMRTGRIRLFELKGFATIMPFAFAGILVGTLSIAGLPLTSGFVSKWLGFSAMYQNHNFIIMAFAVAGSFLTLVYLWKIIEILYFNKLPTDCEEIEEKGMLAKISIVMLIFANIYFGIFTHYNSEVVLKISEYLMEYKITK